MERLTEKGHVYHALDFMEDGISYFVNKLREYEDAEEQGLLLRLPFPIGTSLYKVAYSSEHKIGCVMPTMMTLKNYADNKKAFDEGEYYLTKEEAEQKLAEMKG